MQFQQGSGWNTVSMKRTITNDLMDVKMTGGDAAEIVHIVYNVRHLFYRPMAAVLRRIQLFLMTAMKSSARGQGLSQMSGTSEF